MSRKFFTLLEHRRQPLATREVFFKRVARCIWAASLLLFSTIFLGTAVYHFVEKFSWIDAAMNAVMIMTGLGLVDNLHSDTAKIFT